MFGGGAPQVFYAHVSNAHIDPTGIYRVWFFIKQAALFHAGYLVGGAGAIPL